MRVNNFQSLFNAANESMIIWIFVLSFLLAFLFLYQRIRLKFIHVQPVQLTYVFSFVFTITTLILSIQHFSIHFSLWIFGITGLLYWIVYFGWTPRWSANFVMAILFAILPMIIGNSLLAYFYTENMIFSEYETSHITILSAPLELYYLEFLMSYLGVATIEFFRKKEVKS